MTQLFHSINQQDYQLPLDVKNNCLMILPIIFILLNPKVGGLFLQVLLRWYHCPYE